MGFTATILQKVVKNEAMKQDPPEIYGARVILLAFSACFGAMLFGMDIGIIGGVVVLDSFKEKYGLMDLDDSSLADLTSNIVSCLQGGCFFGALGAYWVADKIGRKPSLLISAAIAIVGVVMQAAGNGHLTVLYLGRVIAGLGVGAASMITPLYVSENAPRAIRGALTGIYQLFVVTGSCLAFWINYGSSVHSSGAAIYTVPLAMQALPAVLMLVCMFFCNESPRWLARADRWEEATSTLATVRRLPTSHEYIKSEIAQISEQLEHERKLVGGAGFMDLQREMWTIPGNRKRALISIALMVCQQMTGTNAVNYYAPTIFQNLGLSSTDSSLFATGVYGIVKMVTCSIFLIFVADSLGRRRSLLWTSIAQGCAMFYIGLFVRITPPVEGEPVSGAGYFALVCVYLYAAFFQFGWGPVCWILVSEIPSARLRSMNVAYGAATQWLFNFVVAKGTPSMLVTMGEGGYGCFLLYGSFCFSFFIFVWFLIPETKGLPLEKMDDLFGVTELVKRMEEEDPESRAQSHEAKRDQKDETRIEEVAH